MPVFAWMHVGGLPLARGSNDEGRCCGLLSVDDSAHPSQKCGKNADAVCLQVDDDCAVRWI